MYLDVSTKVVDLARVRRAAKLEIEPTKQVDLWCDIHEDF
jgi:hypothetical protein